MDELVDALDSIGPVSRSEEQRGVWTVTGRDSVADRASELVESAEEEIVYMTVDGLLTDETLAQLRAASDRGVSIKLGGMSESVVDEIADVVPEAEVFDSMWVWSDTPAGRLLMVDQRRTLVSVLVAGDDTDSPEQRDETAIWGTGETNSLVVVLKEMFTWQLDGTRD